MSLSKLPDRYEYAYAELDESRKTSFRVKEVKDELTAMMWLKEYSGVTRTEWRVLQTFPNSGRINMFRKRYRCQHKTDSRGHEQIKRKSKHTGCPAELDITIVRYVKKSRAKDPSHLAAEFPCIITLKNQHNHSTENAEALKHLPINEDTRQKLIHLFHRGHSPASALQSLKMELMITYPDTFRMLSADASKIPSSSVVWHLFHTQFASQYGERSGDQMFADLEQFISSYNSDGTGGSAVFNRVGDNYFVAAVTPIMCRVHEKIPQTAEMLLVDASGGMDRQKHRIYMFVVPTAAGGLPAGTIITDCERKEVFSVALDALLRLLPSCKFFGKGYPAVIITDNDLKEREPLARVFPSAKLLLCQFHVLKAVWSWLCNARHKIDKATRQGIYFQFKGCLYSRTVDDFEKRYTKLLDSEACKQDLKVSKYLGNLLSDRESWATCFRTELPTRGSNTTNYVEVVFKILKDTIFDRVMAYNITQLLDYLVTRFEQYFHGRLLDFANGRYKKSLLRNMLVDSSVDTKEVVDHQDGTFSVPSESHPDTLHSVDIMRGTCDCDVGSNGTLCKHMSAVISSIDFKLSSESALKLVSANTRAVMFEVATGHKPPNNWLTPLLLNDSQIETHCTQQIAASYENDSDMHVLQPTGNATGSSSTLPSNHVAAALDKWGELIESLHARVTEGLHNSPEIFIPAVNKCTDNLAEFVNTESSLVTMLHTMGKYTGFKQKQARRHPLPGRRHGGIRIGVQPTAIARRKYCLSGKRKQSAGRPPGNVRRPFACEEQCSETFNVPARKKQKASMIYNHVF